MHQAVGLRQLCECIVQPVCYSQPPTLHTQPAQQDVGLNNSLKGLTDTPSSTVSCSLQAVLQETET